MNPIISFFFIVMFFLAPLGTSAQNRDASELKRTLANGSVDQKREALAWIRSSNDPELARIALASFNDKNSIIRASAISSAQNSPSDLLVPALETISKDKSLLVRKEVAVSLGKIHDDGRVTGILRERLRREKDREVRAAIIESLGLVGSLNDFSILMGELTKKPSESNEFERAMAARAIGQIARRNRGAAPARSIPSSFNKKSDPSNPDETIAVASLFEFARFESQVISILIATSESANVRRECAFLLGEAGGHEGYKALRRFIGDEDPYLSRIAKEALQTMIERSTRKEQ